VTNSVYSVQIYANFVQMLYPCFLAIVVIYRAKMLKGCSIFDIQFSVVAYIVEISPSVERTKCFFKYC